MSTGEFHRLLLPDIEVGEAGLPTMGLGGEIQIQGHGHRTGGHGGFGTSGGDARQGKDRKETEGEDREAT